MTELVSLIFLAIWFAVSYVVFQHAEENGHNAWLWAIVVFLFGVFGLIAYGVRLLV